MYRLYDYLDSGNGYKVRQILRLRKLPYQLVQVDIFKGESRTPEFLAKNPNGRIPLLELPDGRLLAESNAILFYLAEGTNWLPEDSFDRAFALQWLCFEQYSHEPNIATVRMWVRHGGIDDPDKQGLLAQKRKLGYAALSVMETHLATRSFFVAERFTIADIALYAYTHVAEQGGWDLAPYPAVRRWLLRCAAEPGVVDITAG
ncbi:MAG: glutathione S-transferase family protein [Polyangiales bacterium]